MRFGILALTMACLSVQAADKLTLWNAHNPSQYLDSAILQFEQNHKITIEKNNFLSERLREEVLNQARTNTLPDILYVPSDFVGMHQLISLSPVPKDWIAEDNQQRILSAGFTDGEQYGVPLFQGNHLVLYYNKNLVKQPVTSWSELLEQQAALAQDGQEAIVWNFAEMYWFIPFLTAFDGWPLDQGKITLDTEPMRNALRYYKELRDIGLVDPACNHDCSVERFKSGEAAYMINGDWIYSDLSQTMGEKLGVSMLPTIQGKAMKPMFSGYVLAFPGLSKNSKKYQSIKAFTLYMQSAEAQGIIYEEGGLIPANKHLLSRYQHSQSANDQQMLLQMEQTKAMPSAKQMTIVWLALERGFSRYMEHNYSVEQATQYMQSIADRETEKRGQ